MITSKSQLPETSTPSYPALFQNVESSMVLLAIDKRAGVVVHQGDGTWKTGMYCDDWIAFDNRDHWKPFVGTIQLSNAS